jgi:hypothetical protein
MSPYSTFEGKRPYGPDGTNAPRTGTLCSLRVGLLSKFRHPAGAHSPHPNWTRPSGMTKRHHLGTRGLLIEMLYASECWGRGDRPQEVLTVNARALFIVAGKRLFHCLPPA